MLFRSLDPKRYNPRQIHALISNAKNELIGPADYTNQTTNHFEEIVAETYSIYQRKLHEGNVFDFDDLTIDHVKPVSRGGRTEWENCVTACKSCNHRKGSKLQKPMRMPFKPDYYALVNKWKQRPITIRHPSWNNYLNVETTKLVSHR